ncbi:MAG: flagellar hook capping protein [Comamonadaceae bacterium]|nr:MAG: flagellar hook capping protein [Comamonadaceae bacterium]
MAIGAVASSAATLQNNSLSTEDFMKILMTQLTYQDPLKPMDNQQFMAQMAQFTSLEQTQRLNEKLDQLIGNQAALQSVGLIGRAVDVQTPDGRISGTVASLSLQGEAPLVTVNTAQGGVLSDLALSQILIVR